MAAPFHKLATSMMPRVSCALCASVACCSWQGRPCRIVGCWPVRCALHSRFPCFHVTALINQSSLQWTTTATMTSGRTTMKCGCSWRCKVRLSHSVTQFPVLAWGPYRMTAASLFNDSSSSSTKLCRPAAVADAPTAAAVTVRAADPADDPWYARKTELLNGAPM